jgi:hypothetical protein
MCGGKEHIPLEMRSLFVVTDREQQWVDVKLCADGFE